MSSMASSEALDRSAQDKTAPVAAEPKKSKARPYLILAAVLGLAAASTASSP